MITANIKIITSSGKQIDYKSPADLNIKMQRIADDMQDIEARFGEYSLTFSIPKTRNNVEIMQYAGINGVKNAFKANPIAVDVYNNDLLIVSGQLELTSIKEDVYECVFYSKFTQLVDSLQDKNMQDIQSCPKITWNYESTIVAHVNAGYADCDATPYQFPMMFYNTYFCPTSVFTGLTDTVVDVGGQTNHVFQRERDQQNWYYYINHSSIGENEAYFHQFPLAFYLKPMMEYMLNDIGWSMGGSFWEDDNIKKIIVPYVGDTDVYDRAVYCTNGAAITGSSCGAGTLMLDTAKFMPDYGCVDFLSDIILTFNLYFNIDVVNKTIIFETYDTMFGSKVAPYDITEKLIGDTIEVSKIEDYNPSISFDKIDNQRVLGDNRYFGSSGTSMYTAKYLVTSNNTLFNQVYNYIGTTDGEIKIGFGCPAVKRMRIRNEYNYADSNQSAGDHVLFLPFISKQLPEDNKNKNFSKKDGDTTAFNNEDTIQYNGKPTLYYYYGISTSNIIQKSGKGSQSGYFYINFNDVNQKIGIASPFAFKTYRDNINTTLTNAGLNPLTSADDADVMLASYMQSIYLMLYNGLTPVNELDFSLVLCDNNNYGDTLYTKFHANKYKRYQQSELLTADMRMTDNDWNIMQINQPIKYNNIIYSLVEINNYDIVKQQAEIKIIKQL
jgi:hypothetical protein